MPFGAGGLTRAIMVSLAQLLLFFLSSLYSNEEVMGVRSGRVQLGNIVARGIAGKQIFVKNLKFLCLSAIL
jgi:hypothetical protein